MKKIILVLTFLAISIFPKISFAQSNILVNEFVVDQSPQAVELMNFGTQPVDLSSWYIDDNGGTTFYTIPAATIIYPNTCLVFASEFNLNRSSTDVVRLFDSAAIPSSSSAHLIDSLSYATSPGGTLSFSRVPDGSTWITTAESMGKFNSTGQSCIFIPSPTPTFTPTPTTVLTPITTLVDNLSPTPSQLAVENISISEVMANPETGEKEWVELHNDNDFEVNLVNWYIDDEENAGSAPKQFSLTVPAKGYVSFDLTTGIFNNDTDSVRLLDQNKVVVDSMQYSITQKGKTVGRTDFTTDTFCTQVASKNVSNSPCILVAVDSPTPTIASITKTPTPTKSALSPTALTSIESSLQSEISLTPTPIYETYSAPFKQSVIAANTSSSSSDETSPPTTHPQNALQFLLKSFSFSSGSLSVLGALSLLLKLKLKQL